MFSQMLGSLRSGGRKGVALRGTAWTTIGFVVSYGVRLVSTLILTRLLAPEAFGLMSLAMVFVTGMQMLSDVGTVPSIIRSKRGDDPVFLRTAWSIQLVRGGLLCLGLIAISWPVSHAYSEPMLFPLLIALALNPLLQGTISIAVASCQRHTDLKWITLQDAGGQILATIINILIAWWLGSVWALVVGVLAGTAFRVFLSYYYLPQRVKSGWQWERQALDEIVKFGRWILLGTLFTYLGGQGSVAITGFLVPVETLGLFAIATTFSGAVNALLQKIMNQVAFPAMARIHQDDPEKLSAAVGKLKKMILIIILPSFLLLSVGARPLVDFLYDPRYAEAGVFLSFTALNMAIATMGMPYQNALLTTGNSRAHSMVMGTWVAIRMLAIAIGFWAYDFIGVLIATGIGGVLIFGVTVWLARRSGRAHFRYDILGLSLIFVFYLYAWSQVAYA
ncbi:oligosaccharide flippase family protein [Thioclava kandeliae]|uniref:Oligosaccharide flippase family protein n=1 Tax=Thioclava kandeliae TaxID=3070818 RepID=A0ABV1SM22_9RHOB